LAVFFAFGLLAAASWAGAATVLPTNESKSTWARIRFILILSSKPAISTGASTTQTHPKPLDTGVTQSDRGSGNTDASGALLQMCK
jgi:hypothetical protein